MIKKNAEETKDQQQKRVMQFSQAVEKNTSLFKSVMIFLALIVALVAFLALVYGDACWAKSFPHKDYRLIKVFVCLVFAVVAFAIIAISSSEVYLTMVDEISAKTRGMYKAWILDSTDFRHDIDAKITTLVQYATKELTGLFTAVSSVGIIASLTAAIYAFLGYDQFCDELIHNSNLCGFALIHTVIICVISIAVVLLAIAPILKEAIDLTKINFNSSELFGSINHSWDFNTTFADRLALLQMPPKHSEKNN